MNILYISQYFYPEMGAPSARVFELSKYWTKLGHKVTILTCFPNYPDGLVHEDYKRKIKKLILHEQIDGLDVYRTYVFPTHLRSPIRRGLNYLSFFISSSLVASFLNNYNVVIATSPSLLVGLTGLFHSRIKRIPFVFEVRDLWPEVIPAVGFGRENTLIYKVFDKIASILYTNSDIIVTVTNSFKDHLVSGRGIALEKIRVIENAVDTDFFKPFRVDPFKMENMGLNSKFVVSYIGTIGYTHGVEVILKAARKIKQIFPNLIFLLVGDGSDRKRLEIMKNEERLDNVLFVGQQPKTKIPIYINASDISLVLSSKQVFFQKTIFAKVFEPMACAKPIIVGALGETRKIVVENANAGIDFEPENPQGLINAVVKLYDNPELRNELGENGRDFVSREFSRSLKAKQYSEILEEVVRKHKSVRSN